MGSTDTRSLIDDSTETRMTPPRILILSASAGAGHVRAAHAIEHAVCALGTCDVRHVDSLDHTTKVFRRLYQKAYIDMVNHAPEVLGVLYDHLDKPWKYERRRLAWDQLNTRPFVELIKSYDPAWAVCTHFLPAEIVSWLKARRRLRARLAVVVTDLDVHGMWLYRHVDRYFVALDETREHLVRLGIDREKITVSGIPVDPSFAAPQDKHAMRRKHRFSPDRTTILVAAGGFGVGPVEHLVSNLLQLTHRAQVVVICGRSEDLKRRVDKVAAAVPADANVTITALGFTTEMDELMAASDILVGKPGGLTTSEALAKGLAFVIVNPIPGQEERNADHLLEQGAAIRCNNLPVLAWKVDCLLDDPLRLARMHEQARRLARPHAARDIADALLGGPVGQEPLDMASAAES
jgi:processive 1,2-diacylglycerol beta-glucosyltransferase